MKTLLKSEKFANVRYEVRGPLAEEASRLESQGEKVLLKDDWMEPIRKAAKAAEQLGFDFVQAHSPCNNFMNPQEDFETVVLANLRSIEACGYLGIPNIVVHSGTSHTYRYPGDMERYIEANRRFYESLYPAMEKYNVRVLIENGATANMGDQCFPMTGRELADFIETLGHPLLGACWDVGHANLQDPDQYKDIVAMGSHLKAVHIQDARLALRKIGDLGAIGFNQLDNIINLEVFIISVHACFDGYTI